MVRAMTTLKPQLVRADTLDLQDPHAPSAQDHTRQPGRPSPYGFGPAAPHQAQTLRYAQQEAYHQQHTSPGGSRDTALGGYHADQHFYDDPEGEHDDDDDDNDQEDDNGNDSGHLDDLQNGTNGYHGPDDEVGEPGDSQDEDLDDDLMDKISSSPSIEDEDINFEFVYALHTFVATVEGQANATKGDTMVLLDDSNSYWWLVRIVKDGSIGYLPAEHIETPTERLARLNKHRNIDLSASMLGDSAEKSKNPLKKAMRRRNAKTVQFSAPTYYEPSEYDYSEEEEEDGASGGEENGGLDASTDDIDADHDRVVASPDSVDAQEQKAAPTNNGIQRITSGNDNGGNAQPSSPVKAHAGDGVSESGQSDELVSRSRRGVVRNTDSFFRDDSVETKKISLTPRLLRGDSDLAGSSVEPDTRQRPSLESFDKMIASDDKSKDERKKKEKKGMLSGLFKRKEKTARGNKTDHEEAEKVSEESLRQSPQSKDSLESISSKPERSPERRPSKLHKPPPSYTPSKTSPTDPRAPQREFPTPTENVNNPSPTGLAPAPATLRQVEPESPLSDEIHPSTQDHAQPPRPTPHRFPSLTEKRSIFSPLTTVLKPSPSFDGEIPGKPVHSKRAKERFAIDQSDSEDDGRQEGSTVSPLVDSQEARSPAEAATVVSPVEASIEAPHQPNSLSENLDRPRTANADDGQTPPPAVAAAGATTRLSPLPVEIPHMDSEPTASTSKPSPSTTTHTPSTSRSTPTWSDASLRSYLDNEQDIKDLLIIVHDKSNVSPVGPDHPLMANLFSDERTKLVEMQSQLDALLMNWMSKKNASLLSAMS